MSAQTNLLKKPTDTFFDRHWKEQPDTRPIWQVWKLDSQLPAGDRGRWHREHLGGCYAVFAGEKLLYVGLALTSGRNPKNEKSQRGIIDRLRRHVIEDPDKNGIYELNKKKKVLWPEHLLEKGLWAKAAPLEPIQIHVIAFPNHYRYLAAALEAFLIFQLEPPCNKTVPKKQYQDA